MPSKKELKKEIKALKQTIEVMVFISGNDIRFKALSQVDKPTRAAYANTNFDLTGYHEFELK